VTKHLHQTMATEILLILNNTDHIALFYSILQH